MLSLLIFTPLLFSVILVFVPKPQLVRYLSVGFSVVYFLSSLSFVCSV